MTMIDELAFHYALWRMKQLSPEKVPAIACGALEAGLDRPTSTEIGRAFDDACSQLGVAPAATHVVEERLKDIWIWNATQIAKHISAQILDGTLDPVAGWLSLPYREGELGPLSVFFEFADRLGRVSFDEQFRAQLINAAKRFQSIVSTE